MTLRDIKYCSALWDRLFGLLIRSNPRSLLFQTRFGIHTFFLKESILVLVLDDDFKVIKLKTLAPNRLFFWHPKYQWVLELPSGLSKKISLGDQLDFEPKVLN